MRVVNETLLADPGDQSDLEKTLRGLRRQQGERFSGLFLEEETKMNFGKWRQQLRAASWVATAGLGREKVDGSGFGGGL